MKRDVNVKKRKCKASQNTNWICKNANLKSADTSLSQIPTENQLKTIKRTNKSQQITSRKKYELLVLYHVVAKVTTMFNYIREDIL